jgi:glycosyltransferase involved in cell wall biosynthesis
MVNLSFKISDLITVESKASYNIVAKRKARRCRLEIISWGVDLDKFTFSDNKAYYQRRINISGQPLIISPRGLGKMYNIDVIIESIPLVLKELPEAKFLFLGPFKENYHKYEALSLSLGVRQAVEFIGKVEHDILPDYFKASDIAVSIPSSDSVSISLLEGMACGVPPIVGAVEAARDWITDSENGYMVPPRDKEALAEAIIKTVRNKSLTQHFIERNLDLVREKADHNKHMEKVEELYRKLIKGRRRG